MIGLEIGIVHCHRPYTEWEIPGIALLDRQLHMHQDRCTLAPVMVQLPLVRVKLHMLGIIVL